MTDHLGLKYQKLILVDTLQLDLEHTTMELFVEVILVQPLQQLSQTKTETYNGTSWTELNDLNSAVETSEGAGTQTAGIAIGGSPRTAVVEQYMELTGLKLQK